MGQIIGGAAKPKRCNLNKLSQLGTPAAGEHILVSSDNSMNAAGQGNFDCYIVGDGTTAATALKLKSVDTLIGAFDISAYHATGDVLAKYADLSAALGANGANIPQPLRKGGMSVKFVQSSDNKYVQYRLMSDTFSTTESDWQGADDEPTSFSDNLIKSGSVFSALNNVSYEEISLTNYINGWIKVTGAIGGGGSYRAYYFPVSVNDVFKLRFDTFTSVEAHAYAVYSAENIADIGADNKIEIGPVGQADTDYFIQISNADAKWLVIQELYAYSTLQYGAELSKVIFTNKFTKLQENILELNHLVERELFKSKNWTISGNVVYDDNEIPQEYDITWADGVNGHVVLSNFNDDVFEYCTITATYNLQTIVYTLTYDVNGYITNEIFNIQ